MKSRSMGTWVHLSPLTINLTHEFIVLCISKHIVHVDSKGAKCEFFWKIHNFKNIIHNYIIPCVWIAPVLMHKCANMKALNLNMLAGEGYKNITKIWKLHICHLKTTYLPFENYRSYSPNISRAHTWGACACICKIESFWSNLWLGGLSTDDTNTNDDQAGWNTWNTIHDYIGSLAVMPNEPKSTPTVVIFLHTHVFDDNSLWCNLYKTYDNNDKSDWAQLLRALIIDFSSLLECSS